MAKETADIRNSMVLYRGWYEAIKKQPPEDQYKYYAAIIDYALDGKEPNKDDIFACTLLEMARQPIDLNIKRWQDAQKGGRRKKGKTNDDPILAAEEEKRAAAYRKWSKN